MTYPFGVFGSSTEGQSIDQRPLAEDSQLRFGHELVAGNDHSETAMAGHPLQIETGNHAC